MLLGEISKEHFFQTTRSDMSFIEVTEIDERGIRRLAQSRGTMVSRTGENSYVWDGVAMSDDEVWDALRVLPQVETLSGRGVRI
jgi:hypothetical protein